MREGVPAITLPPAAVQPLGMLAIIAGLLALALPFGVAPQQDPAAFGLSVAACVLAGLAWRWPVPAGVLQVAVLSAVSFTKNGAIGLALMALLLTLGFCATQRHWLAAGLFASAFFALSVSMSARAALDPHQVIQSVDFWLVFYGAPLVVAASLNQLRGRAAHARLVAEQAAVDQRREIARNLHDTVVRATTSMVMRAEAARARGVDEATAVDLGFIAEAGRAANGDLRAMLGLLRANHEVGTSPHAAVPGFGAALATAISALTAAGYDASLQVEGDVAAVPAPVAAVLGHATAEAVANIERHAEPRTSVAVMVDAGGDDVTAAFISTLPRNREQDESHEPLGLQGMRERVEALGGEVNAGPTGSRWITQVRVPIHG